MDGKTSPQLLEDLQADPEQHINLIVTVRGDPTCYVWQIQELHLEVRRTFSLTQKLALGGSARAFLTLSQKDWVTKLEEDRLVKALGD
jgi:hypothetical protein